MKLTEKQKKTIEKSIMETAAKAFLCNVGDEDFPDNFIELLSEGKTEDEKGHEIVIWDVLEHKSPEEIAGLILDNSISIRNLLLDILEIYGTMLSKD